MTSDGEDVQDSPSNQMALEDALNSALGANSSQELSNTAKAYGPRQAQWKASSWLTLHPLTYTY